MASVRDNHILDLRHVDQTLGGTRILNDLSLGVAPSEFTAILGPSGCGKSTTLRLMAGLDRPSKGSVHMGGRDVTDDTPAMRNIAMVFQSYALYPHLTVAENIALPLVMRECGAAERMPFVGALLPSARDKRRGIAERVRRIAAMLEIEPLLDRKPGALSGGQQQRVAVGRALVRDPALFLLDEPLSNLDAKLRIQMRTELSALHRRSGKAFVYVTHDQIEAMTMADRVLLMLGGRVIQDGPPRELYERPASREVAAFIGAHTMNLIDLPPPAGDADHPLARLGLALPNHGGRVTVGLRPEHLKIAASAADGFFQARVERLEYHGRDTMVTLRLDGVEATVDLLQDAQALSLNQGDQVGLACRSADVHLFDTETGRRLDPSACGGA